MQKDIKFASNQRLFVAWRRIVHGFDGYEYPPDLSETAKSILARPDG